VLQRQKTDGKLLESVAAGSVVPGSRGRGSLGLRLVAGSPECRSRPVVDEGEDRGRKNAVLKETGRPAADPAPLVACLARVQCCRAGSGRPHRLARRVPTRVICRFTMTDRQDRSSAVNRGWPEVPAYGPGRTLPEG
jgi:hypothetical protein